MALPAGLPEYLKSILPSLTPQPVVPQLAITMELAEAEEQLGISMTRDLSSTLFGQTRADLIFGCWDNVTQSVLT